MLNVHVRAGEIGRAKQTVVTLHPGEVLAIELEARQIKKVGFAVQLGIKPSQLSELLHGKRHDGAQMALRLENVLGMDADFGCGYKRFTTLLLSARNRRLRQHKFRFGINRTAKAPTLLFCGFFI